MKNLILFILGAFICLSVDLYSQTNKVSQIENKQPLNKFKKPIRALLIGVNRPEDDLENITSSSIKDVEELVKELKTRNSKSYIKTLLREKATSKEIWKAIDDIIINGDTSYTRFIYIGSHGDKYGFRPYSKDGFETILWSQLNEKLKLCKSSKKIILVMTCHANSIAKEETQNFIKNIPDKSWTYLTSSKSFESSFGRNSNNFNSKEQISTLFTSSFLFCLQKENSISKIFEEMSKTITKKVKGTNEEQTPQLVGNTKLILDF